MNKKIFVFGTVLACLLFGSKTTNSFAADFDIPANIMNTNYDLNSVFEKERELEMEKDFTKLKKDENGDTKNDIKKEDVKKEKKGKVVEAKIEEYATKGVFVKNIEVSPSSILTEEEIKNIIDEYKEDNLTIDEMQEIIDKINTLYLSKGFVTARAYLPEQTILGNTIKIELVEGKVGDVKIQGNKWTRGSFIEKRVQMNNLDKGSIFNIGTLENNIVNFNRYNTGINLKATLLPGTATQQTTDIILDAEETSPFHINFLVDNAGRDTTGAYRAGLVLQDESLFGFRDRLTIGTYVSRYAVTPFADYNIPVNKRDGRVGFMFSMGQSKIGYGPYSPFDIKSRSFIYSLYFSQPIIRKPYMELASISSLNYKHAGTSFDGEDLKINKIPSAQTGLTFRYDTERGIWYANQNVSYSAPIFDEESNYVKIDGGITRLHDFGHGIVGQLRGNYQVIPTNIVPSIDQFQLGGMNTIRGYSEGLIIGRSGYMVSGEMMVPILPRTILSRDKTKRIPFIGKYIKGIAFVDQGMVFPYKGSGNGSEGLDSSDIMMSVGIGLKILLPGDVTAKLSWGFPCIRNKYEDKQTWGRFHFEISLAPDIDAIVKWRKPKNPKEEL